MPNFKNARHSEDIHRELTDILRSLKDPRIDPMLSVVRTELSRDGSSCKVYVSSLSGLETARESVKGLKSAAGYIRREIGSRLQLRYTPELQFFMDDSIAHGAHILDLLNHVKPANPANADIVLPEDKE